MKKPYIKINEKELDMKLIKTMNTKKAISEDGHKNGQKSEFLSKLKPNITHYIGQPVLVGTR